VAKATTLNTQGKREGARGFLVLSIAAVWNERSASIRKGLSYWAVGKGIRTALRVTFAVQLGGIGIVNKENLLGQFRIEGRRSQKTSLQGSVAGTGKKEREGWGVGGVWGGGGFWS